MDIARLAANNLTDFKVVTSEQYVRARHLDYLDRILMQVQRYLETGEGIKNLIIQMPPRHGKSLTVSRVFPAWVLGRRPDTNIILGSYGADLAEDHSRAARNLVSSEKFKAIFPQLGLQTDLQKVGDWGVTGPNDTRGGMVAVGFGGAVVGKGAHLLIIDDPIKNRQEAESANIRDMTWAAYTNDFLSRFNNAHRAAQIIMAQRYHTDDLIGRILNSPMASKFHVLNLPALAEDDDILGRKEGEALWPERYDEAALADTEEMLGDYAFAAQYQQRPIPRDSVGWDITKIEFVESTPVNAAKFIRFYDLAVATKKRSDYTVALKAALLPNGDFYVDDVFRDKIRPAELLDQAIRLARMDGKACRQVLEGEKAGLINLDLLVSDPRAAEYPFETSKIEGDKDSRALNVQTRMAAGRVKMRRASWNAELLEELRLGKAAKHDDQQDALSGAYNYLAGQKVETASVTSLGVLHDYSGDYGYGYH